LRNVHAAQGGLDDNRVSDEGVRKFGGVQVTKANERHLAVFEDGFVGGD